MVFACSPNNPTGTVEPAATIEALLDATAGLVVVDEAYGEFAPRSALDCVRDDGRLVVARTYSKVWSMAALRLGFAVAPPWVVAELEKVVLPYHLAVPTQVAGRVALDWGDEMSDRVIRLVAERERVIAALDALDGVTAFPSGANFVLFRVASGRTVWDALVQRGVLVRDCSGWPGLDDCLRVTIGTPDENDAFLDALPASIAASAAGRPRRRTPDGAHRDRSSARRRRPPSSSRSRSTAAATRARPPASRSSTTCSNSSASTGASTSGSSATGDLEVDLHHTVEDVGIVLGSAFSEALGDKAGVRRFANSLVPLDEALVQVALDLSGRPFLVYEVDPVTEWIGTFDPQLAEEFWRAFTFAAGITLHVRSLTGKNGHHVIEASFKGVARALRDAVRIEGTGVPSTKGSLWVAFELYPAIDLRGGRCVRLFQGDYAQETVYDDDPVRVAREFEDAGAPWIHVVDLDAARTGESPPTSAVIEAMCAAVRCRVQSGGGVRSVEAAGDAAARRGRPASWSAPRRSSSPTLVEELATLHPGAVAVGLDARGTRGRGAGLGRGIRAPTSWRPRAGSTTRRWPRSSSPRSRSTAPSPGPDVEQLVPVLGRHDGAGDRERRSRHARRRPCVARDLRVDDRGLAGVIVGKALYEQRFTVAEALADPRLTDDGCVVTSRRRRARPAHRAPADRRAAHRGAWVRSRRRTR